ncbi:hypothetical protein ACSVDA_23105 [Cytobacillus sp. Hm23]
MSLSFFVDHIIKTYLHNDFNLGWIFAGLSSAAVIITRDFEIMKQKIAVKIGSILIIAAVFQFFHIDFSTILFK